MRSGIVLVALLLLVVPLAGCADGADPVEQDPTDVRDRDDVDLGSGKGAIQGLLVDDRFRPIDLESGVPDGEFQAQGFVLIQETGKQFGTNENGEFQVLNLDPGTYTIRVQSEKHEATPQKVQVSAGEFAETNIVARRVAGDDSALLTLEYSVFLDCALSLVVALPFECSADLSGDSHRRSFVADYTQYADATALVSEMKATQEKRFEVDLWWPDGDTIPFYANDVFTGDYIRMVLKMNETNTEHEAIFTNDPWINEYPLLTEIIVYGEGSEELGQVDDFFLGGGVGIHLAVQARFLHSLFLGELPSDFDSYCVYC